VSALALTGLGIIVSALLTRLFLRRPADARPRCPGCDRPWRGVPGYGWPECDVCLEGRLTADAPGGGR